MQNETLIEGQAPDQTLDPSPADMPADAATEAEAADPSTPQRPKRRRFIDRAKLIKVNDMAELSALIRCLRLRVGFTQAEAADILGVGRRWYNDLENGKETIRAGMIFKVLASFDCSLALVGPGADFTKHDLEKKAVVKGREEHVWEAQMRSSRRLPKTRRRRRGVVDEDPAVIAAVAEARESDIDTESPKGRGHRKGHIRKSEVVSKNTVKLI